VANWTLDDNAANTAVVDSSDGNNGIAQQNTSAISITGRIDGALSFNGIDDYIQIADSDPLSPTQEITVCGWFYFNDASENVGLIWKHSYNYALWTQGDIVRFGVWNSLSEGSQATFSTSLLGSGWNFIAGVFDGTNSALYLDGGQVGTLGASITGGIRDRAGDLYIGQRPDGAGQQYFDGKIDDVKIFDTALSQAEVGILYNEGTGTAIANHNPLIATIGDKFIEKNQLLSFTVSASDPDGDNLTYSASNLHVGANLDSQTGLFNWTPSDGDVGQYLVTFTVTDDGEDNLTNSETITITVTGSSGMPTPVANWTLDDNAANTAVVDSSDGNNGIAQQNTSAISITGRIDGALSFNGIDDYILVADSELLSPTQQVTVCGWFWFNDTTANTGLIWKHSYNYALWTVSDTVRFAVWNESAAGSTADFATSNLSSGWNFIAGVFDGTNSKLYLNGAETGSIGASIEGPIRDNAGDLYIGYRPGQEYFDGMIDDVKVYDRTLTPAEISSLYNLEP
jgi:hypothetical protein